MVNEAGVLALGVYRIFLLLFLYGSAFGQNNTLKFDHLTVANGLSQGSVYAILQDSRGFMWFGTRFGLNRYDGNEFKHFNHDPKNPQSLPGYRVLALLEDHHSALWAATGTGGLARYERDTETFTNFRHDSTDPGSLSNDLTTCLYEDSNQTLWVGTKQGLNHLDRDKLKFDSYFHIDGDSTSLSDSHISALSELSPGILLIGLNNGSLATLDLQSGKITNIQTGVFRPSRTGFRPITCITRDQQNDFVWLSRFGYGLVKYNLKNGILNRYKQPTSSYNSAGANFLYSITQDQQGKLWLGSVGGLSVFDPETEQLSFNEFNDQNPGSLNDHIVLSSFNDKQGLIWAGSESKGINIYKPNQIRIELFRHEADNASSPSANNIYSIAEDEGGDIWFTTIPGGTNRFNPSTRTFRYYQTDDSKPNWSMNYALQVMIEKSGLVWIGTAAAGLSQIDPVSGERLKLYYNYVLDPYCISGSTINAIYETRDSTIWVGTQNNGLNRYDRKTEHFTRFQNDPENPSSIGGDRIYATLEDHAGVLWIGSAEGGLSRFHAETESFSSFKHTVDDENCIGSNCVLALHEDGQNNLWIGTSGGGLNKLDSDRQTFSTLDLGFDNLDIIIDCILEDDHGYLWLSTNKGVIKADPEQGFLNRYTLIDGLQGNEFYYSSGLKDSQGYMYFGGPNGFNRFHPDSLSNNPHIPPVVITKFKINYADVPIGKMKDGRTILTRSISETKNITVGYQDKIITLTYAALDFSDPRRNRYAYKLDNFDEDWIQVGSNYSVSYTSLEPGDYRFHVKASNNDGLWNEAGIALDITVLPPFWETRWFRLLVSVTLMLMIMLYIQLRFKRLEREKSKLQKLVKERTKELKIEIAERQKVETEKMELKIDHMKRELVCKSMLATENQDKVNGLIRQLKEIQKLDNNEMRKRFNGIVRFSKNLFKAGHDWDEFEKWFTKVHTDFFEKILSEHPELSQRELRVCALIRINLMTKDISNLMKVEPKTIEIYRHRIRHKLGLASDENLNHYLVRY
ncbi:MAG: hypothetical protein HQ506_03030 [Candidatus Marinimicrobia bacterium]|nr:hypothetical protein [Candidatus Neomarinimicrobiota bacterium]